MDPDEIVRILRENNRIRMEHMAVHQELSAVSARMMVRLNILTDHGENLKTDEERMELMELANKYIQQLTDRTRSYVASMSAVSEQMQNEIEELKNG